jgi:hypothetical protein
LQFSEVQYRCESDNACCGRVFTTPLEFRDCLNGSGSKVVPLMYSVSLGSFPSGSLSRRSMVIVVQVYLLRSCVVIGYGGGASFTGVTSYLIVVAVSVPSVITYGKVAVPLKIRCRCEGDNACCGDVHHTVGYRGCLCGSWVVMFR